MTLCINVSRQQPFPADATIGRLQVPVHDDPHEDLYSHFDGCADAIQQEAERGGHALVYCKNGRSRSASVCAAYLMKHHGLSLGAALQVRTQPPLWGSRGFCPPPRRKFVLSEPETGGLCSGPVR